MGGGGAWQTREQWIEWIFMGSFVGDGFGSREACVHPTMTAMHPTMTAMAACTK